MTLLPGESFLFPWTFLTAGFVEPYFLGLLIALLTLAPSFRYLERLWGSFETAKFIGIVITVSNFVAFILSWIEYLVLGSENFLYKMDYYGLTALQTGVLVAFTQLIPEHQVQFFGSLRIRVKRLPMIYVTISNVLCIIGYQSPWILIQFGWLSSWAYLRFYKRTTDALSGIDTYGDRSETFAFIHWFPPFVHKPLSIASTFTHNLAVKFKIIRPFAPSADDLETGVYSSLSNAQPGGARAEAERRRALALKALDSRLANATNNRPGTPSKGLPAASASATTGPTASSSAPAANGAASTRKSVDQGKGKNKVSQDPS
ncbi:SubName: Full=Related to human PL6 protein {ECO:0000313/EMBL:CCA67679.1} [Serendipita indica DSM 11827]|nr:SubName: Full=Related to human PL6 protein {ECO:0000313/EMBL:CCA67679.1} [Serendipita indica DSM 11827]